MVIALAVSAACDGSEPAQRQAEREREVTDPEFPIKHVVFIIKENRTFDHYFGRYPGADGARVGKTSSGETIRLSPAPDFMGHDLGHSFFDGVTAINGGKMNGFDRIFNGELLTGYTQFNRRTLPAYWSYADNFVLGDRMFSSMYGPTLPEHLYTVAAQAGRVTDNKLNPGKLAPGGYCDDRSERVTRFVRLSGRERKEVMRAEERADLDPVSVIRELMERSESREVRADLRAVAAQLREMSGLTPRDAIERLMQRGPHRGYESGGQSNA